MAKTLLWRITVEIDFECPNREQLASFLTGELEEDVISQIESHLVECNLAVKLFER